MSEFRRRLMMMGSGFEIPYITNGLVFYLDGIEKGRDDSGWKELIQGKIFTYNSNNSTDSNSVIFLTRGQTAMVRTDYDTISSDVGTVEVCCSNISTSATSAIVSQYGINPVNSIGFWLKTNGIIYMFRNDSNNNKRYNFSDISSTFTASANINLSLFNGVKHTAKTSDTTTGNYGKKITIGGRTDGNKTYNMAGNIHAVRIYNRLLTEEEMLSNQRVDNQRFNLGLTL